MIKAESLTNFQPLASSSSSSSRSLYKNLLCLIIGLITGIHFADIWFNETSPCSPLSTSPMPKTSTSPLSRNKTDTTIPVIVESSRPEHATAPADLVEYLHNTTRVLCWIMTNPDNHLTKAIHIRHTWGRRCNKLLFMSSQEDEELQSIALPVLEGRQHLWNKTQLALKYIYDHHLDDADWFLKADDDTYVIMENLRSFLYRYSPDAPVYFGCKFNRYIGQGYMSGGAGYVLSKKALIKFATEAYNNSKVCNNVYAEEDVQLGMCLENIGVMAGDSRDPEGQERFVPLPPDAVMPDHKLPWYSKFVYHRENENVSCCSPNAISFHYIVPRFFYTMDYLIYALRPFGVFFNTTSRLPQKLSASDIISEGLQYFEPLPVPPLQDNDTDYEK